VNGGRNYNGPKVNDSLALVKSGYMLEGLSIPHYAKRFSRRNALKGRGFSRAAKGGSRDNVTGADNQQERSVA
jgi:hypothetical protein